MMGLLSEDIQMSKHLKGKFEGQCLLVNRKDADFLVYSNNSDFRFTTPPAGRSHWIGSPKNWLVDRRAEEVNRIMGVTFKSSHFSSVEQNNRHLVEKSKCPIVDAGLSLTKEALGAFHSNQDRSHVSKSQGVSSLLLNTGV